MLRVLALLLLLFGLSLTVGQLRYSFASSVEAAENRERLRRIAQELELGESAAKVSRLTGERLEGDTIEVDTKLEIGASNWKLLLEFDKSRKLRAIRFRSADTLTVPPPDAPPDRVAGQDNAGQPL